MSENDPTSPDSEEGFAWSVHPARERPGRTVLVSLVILLVGRFVQVETGLLVAGVGAMLVLILVLQRFFFPSRYRIDTKGLSEAGVWGCRQVRWVDVCLAEIGAHGAWISELPKRHWREGRRGVHVLFGRQRERVIAALAEHLPPTVREVALPSGEDSSV